MSNLANNETVTIEVVAKKCNALDCVMNDNDEIIPKGNTHKWSALLQKLSVIIRVFKQHQNTIIVGLEVCYGYVYWI
jgi:hypothetical protein